ncbi:MAG: hypothetical protein IKO05_06740 [Selenomonadaceae bacterium]|nr:hypothetical protein [Selenomonadaceae bacterium]
MNTKKILAAVAVLLILTVAVGVAAFNSWQELKNRSGNPAVAARHAVEAHDLAAFKNLVDLDKLINQAAEEILTAQINSTLPPTAYSMDELQSRYDKLKPDFVNAARAAAEEFISTGKVTFPNAPTDAQKFFKESGVASCEIKSITKPQKDGNIKIVTVLFHNAKMKFNFELELELKPAAENSWRITGARGFENFFSGYRRALRRKLDSLNAPIGRKMDEIFKVKSFIVKNEGGDEYGFSQTLDIALKADVKSDRPLAKIIGNVILTGKDDRESLAPFALDMTDREQGVQIFNVTKTLNPFVRADADAMKHGFRKKDLQIEVTEIIFSDGTNLKLLDRLPD